MRTTLILIAATALLASAAAATYYLDERFEGTEFPPAGWRVFQINNGNWYHGGTWPPGNGYYAAGNATQPGRMTMDYVAAALIAPPFTVPAPKTLYYRFVYCVILSTRGDLPLPGFAGEFYLYYVDTGEPLEHLIFNGPVYPWAEASGAVPVAANRPVTAVWYVAYLPPDHGTTLFDVDTCQICDENLTAVAPASLGRVKALFR